MLVPSGAVREDRGTATDIAGYGYPTGRQRALPDLWICLGDRPAEQSREEQGTGPSAGHFVDESLGVRRLDMCTSHRSLAVVFGYVLLPHPDTPINTSQGYI